MVLQDAAKFSDGFIKVTILFIHQAIEPGDRPSWRRRRRVGGPLQSRDRLVQASFLEIDASEVEWAVRAAHLLDGLECLRRLNQFALFAPAVATFEEQSDAIIIPSLPDHDSGILVGGLE